MRKTARRLRILLLSSPSEVCKFCSIDGGYQLSVAKIAGPTARIAALTGINAIICLLVAGSTPSQIRDIRISSELETTRVLIELNASFHYKVGRLTNPDKVYIDFAETAISENRARRTFLRFFMWNSRRVACSSAMNHNGTKLFFARISHIPNHFPPHPGTLRHKAIPSLEPGEYQPMSSQKRKD